MILQNTYSEVYKNSSKDNKYITETVQIQIKITFFRHCWNKKL